MTEPVGNSPRTHIQSNAHKDREEKTELPVPEKVEKIITGKVIQRKHPWYKRAARSIIADDAQSIGDYIMIDVFIPAVKVFISEIIGKGTDRVLFGTARNRRSTFERPGLRTRYDQYSSPEPRRMLSREARARHDFDQVVLDSRGEAVEVVEALIQRVERFGSASVSDLYDYVGVTGSFADQRWGWTDLRTADVRQVSGGFLVDLPFPDPLR